MKLNTITIKIGGEAGFGIKVAGATLAKIFSRAGYQLDDYTEYPSLIRGGHNAYELTIGEKVYHHVRPVNLLIALNQQTVDLHVSELSPDAGIIFDPDKVKVAPQGRSFPVPFSKLVKDINGSELMKNTVAVGAALAVLGANIEGLLDLLRQTFSKKGSAVVDINIKAANAGYRYVKSNFPDPFAYQVKSLDTTPQIYITGNEAVGFGAIAGGCSAFFAYPMTPATSLMEFMMKVAPKFGVLARQCEDEISVLNSAIGAGFAGARSMVATSGGGYSLMVEATGLSGMTETPVVVFLAQRPGPATGLPTWSGQADLRFVMHAAQDEFPRVIVAPGDAEECFYHTAAALNLAEKYQLPVFVLSDKNLAEGGKTVAVFDQSKIKIERGEWLSELSGGEYLRYKLTSTGVSPRVLPGTEGALQIGNSDEHDEFGYSTDSGDMRTQQMEKRMKKMETLLKELPPPILYGPQKADLTIVSWGSNKGAILQAMEELPGVSVNFLHFIYVWPFPTPEAGRLIREAGKLLVIEQNFSGQFEGLIRQYVGRAPDAHLRKYDGRPFWPHEIATEIKRITKGF